LSYGNTVGFVMSHTQVVSTHWVRMVVNALEQSGMDAKALCEKAGIDYDLLWHSEAQFEKVALLLLWRNAVIESRNPAIGFSSGRITLACYNWLSSI